MGDALTRIAYRNDSGSTVPPHGFIQFSGTPVTTATGDYAMSAVMPGSGSGPFFIDDGKGASSSGDGRYGSCFAAGEGLVWLACVASPSNWQEIGPAIGSFLASTSGRGYYYAGLNDGSNSRVLTIKKGPESERTEWAMILTDLPVGEFASPADVLIDIWETDITTGVLARTSDSTLQGLAAKIYTGCPSSSSSSSADSSQTKCRVAYRNGFWQVTNIYKCVDVVTAVSCSSSGLTVTYGKAAK